MDFNLSTFLDIIKGTTEGKLKAGTPVYHGTDARNRIHIHRDGFRPSQFGWLGKGVYTSPDRKTARLFGPVMRGNLLPHMRIRDFPDYADPREIFGEKPEFSMHRNANIHMNAYDDDGKAYADYDNDLSKSRKFRNTDALRWRIRGEDQVLFLDPKLANAVFDTDGPKAGPKSTYMPIDSPRKYLSNKQLLNTIITGMGLRPDKGSGLGNLIKAFIGGQAGAKFVETGLKRYNEEKAKRDKLRVPTEFNAP